MFSTKEYNEALDYLRFNIEKVQYSSSSSNKTPGNFGGNDSSKPAPSSTPNNSSTPATPPPTPSKQPGEQQQDNQPEAPEKLDETSVFNNGESEPNDQNNTNSEYEDPNENNTKPYKMIGGYKFEWDPKMGEYVKWVTVNSHAVPFVYNEKTNQLVSNGRPYSLEEGLQFIRDAEEEQPARDDIESETNSSLSQQPVPKDTNPDNPPEFVADVVSEVIKPESIPEKEQKSHFSGVQGWEIENTNPTKLDFEKAEWINNNLNLGLSKFLGNLADLKEASATPFEQSRLTAKVANNYKKVYKQVYKYLGGSDALLGFEIDGDSNEAMHKNIGDMFKTYFDMSIEDLRSEAASRLERYKYYQANTLSPWEQEDYEKLLGIDETKEANSSTSETGAEESAQRKNYDEVTREIIQRMKSGKTGQQDDVSQMMVVLSDSLNKIGLKNNSERIDFFEYASQDGYVTEQLTEALSYIHAMEDAPQLKPMAVNAAQNISNKIRVHLSSLLIDWRHRRGHNQFFDIDDSDEFDRSKYPGENYNEGDAFDRAMKNEGTTKVRVSELTADPHRFQYKSFNGSTYGDSDKLKEVKRFSPQGAGILYVWHDPNDPLGRNFVVNGHHRFGLAHRLGYQGKLRVEFIAASTAEEARALGALTNIMEGNGTIWDAAKFLKESNMTKADAAALGLNLKSDMFVKADALINLPSEVWNHAINAEKPVQDTAVWVGTLFDIQKKFGESDEDYEKRYVLNQNAILSTWNRIEQLGCFGNKEQVEILSEIVKRSLTATDDSNVQNFLFDVGVDTTETNKKIESYLDITSQVVRGIRQKLSDVRFLSNNKRIKRINNLDAGNIDVKPEEVERLKKILDGLEEAVPSLLVNNEYLKNLTDKAVEEANAQNTEQAKKNVIGNAVDEITKYLTAEDRRALPKGETAFTPAGDSGTLPIEGGANGSAEGLDTEQGNGAEPTGLELENNSLFPSTPEPTSEEVAEATASLDAEVSGSNTDSEPTKDVNSKSDASEVQNDQQPETTDKRKINLDLINALDPEKRRYATAFIDYYGDLLKHANDIRRNVKAGGFLQEEIDKSEQYLKKIGEKIDVFARKPSVFSTALLNLNLAASTYRLFSMDPNLCFIKSGDEWMSSAVESFIKSLEELAPSIEHPKKTDDQEFYDNSLLPKDKEEKSPEEQDKEFAEARAALSDTERKNLDLAQDNGRLFPKDELDRTKPSYETEDDISYTEADHAAAKNTFQECYRDGVNLANKLLEEYPGIKRLGDQEHKAEFSKAFVEDHKEEIKALRDKIGKAISETFGTPYIKALQDIQSAFDVDLSKGDTPHFFQRFKNANKVSTKVDGELLPLPKGKPKNKAKKDKAADPNSPDSPSEVIVDLLDEITPQNLNSELDANVANETANQSQEEAQEAAEIRDQVVNSRSNLESLIGKVCDYMRGTIGSLEDGNQDKQTLLETLDKFESTDFNEAGELIINSVDSTKGWISVGNVLDGIETVDDNKEAFSRITDELVKQVCQPSVGEQSSAPSLELPDEQSDMSADEQPSELPVEPPTELPIDQTNEQENQEPTNAEESPSELAKELDNEVTETTSNIPETTEQVNKNVNNTDEYTSEELQKIDEAYKKGRESFLQQISEYSEVRDAIFAGLSNEIAVRLNEYNVSGDFKTFNPEELDRIKKANALFRSLDFTTGYGKDKERHENFERELVLNLSSNKKFLNKLHKSMRILLRPNSPNEFGGGPRDWKRTRDFEVKIRQIFEKAPSNVLLESVESAVNARIDSVNRYLEVYERDMADYAERRTERQKAEEAHQEQELKEREKREEEYRARKKQSHEEWVEKRKKDNLKLSARDSINFGKALRERIKKGKEAATRAKDPHIRAVETEYWNHLEKSFAHMSDDEIDKALREDKRTHREFLRQDYTGKNRLNAFIDRYANPEERKHDFTPQEPFKDEYGLSNEDIAQAADKQMWTVRGGRKVSKPLYLNSDGNPMVCNNAIVSDFIVRRAHIQEVVKHALERGDTSFIESISKKGVVVSPQGIRDLLQKYEGGTKESDSLTEDYVMRHAGSDEIISREEENELWREGRHIYSYLNAGASGRIVARIRSEKKEEYSKLLLQLSKNSTDEKLRKKLFWSLKHGHTTILENVLKDNYGIVTTKKTPEAQVKEIARLIAGKQPKNSQPESSDQQPFSRPHENDTNVENEPVVNNQAEQNEVPVNSDGNQPIDQQTGQPNEETNADNVEPQPDDIEELNKRCQETIDFYNAQPADSFMAKALKNSGTFGVEMLRKKLNDAVASNDPQAVEEARKNLIAHLDSMQLGKQKLEPNQPPTPEQPQEELEQQTAKPEQESIDAQLDKAVQNTNDDSTIPATNKPANATDNPDQQLEPQPENVEVDPKDSRFVLRPKLENTGKLEIRKNHVNNAINLERDVREIKEDVNNGSFKITKSNFGGFVDNIGKITAPLHPVDNGDRYSLRWKKIFEERGKMWGGARYNRASFFNEYIGSYLGTEHVTPDGDLLEHGVPEADTDLDGISYAVFPLGNGSIYPAIHKTSDGWKVFICSDSQEAREHGIYLGQFDIPSELFSDDPLKHYSRIRNGDFNSKNEDVASWPSVSESPDGKSWDQWSMLTRKEQNARIKAAQDYEKQIEDRNKEKSAKLIDRLSDFINERAQEVVKGNLKDTHFSGDEVFGYDDYIDANGLAPNDQSHSIKAFQDEVKKIYGDDVDLADLCKRDERLYFALGNLFDADIEQHECNPNNDLDQRSQPSPADETVKKYNDAFNKVMNLIRGLESPQHRAEREASSKKEAFDKSTSPTNLSPSEEKPERKNNATPIPDNQTDRELDNAMSATTEVPEHEPVPEQPQPSLDDKAQESSQEEIGSLASELNKDVGGDNNEPQQEPDETSSNKSQKPFEELTKTNKLVRILQTEPRDSLRHNDAFTKLYKKYSSSVAKHLAQKGFDFGLAEQAVATVWVDIWDKEKGLVLEYNTDGNDDNGFRNWLATCAENKLKSEGRRKINQTISLDQAMSSQNGDSGSTIADTIDSTTSNVSRADRSSYEDTNEAEKRFKILEENGKKIIDSVFPAKESDGYEIANAIVKVVKPEVLLDLIKQAANGKTRAPSGENSYGNIAQRIIDGGLTNRKVKASTLRRDVSKAIFNMSQRLKENSELYELYKKLFYKKNQPFESFVVKYTKEDDFFKLIQELNNDCKIQTV